MMKKTRMLSFVIAIALTVVSVVKMPVYADASILTDETESGFISENVEDKAENGDVDTDKKTVAGLGVSPIGNPNPMLGGGWSFVVFGNFSKYNQTIKKYEKSPMYYRVLSNETTEYGGKTMLLDNDITPTLGDFDNTMPYHYNNWANSTLRADLNSEFLTNRFTTQESEAISFSTKTEPSEYDGESQASAGFAPLDNDKIFILDYVEANRATYGFVNKKDRVKVDDMNCVTDWYLRSPQNGTLKVFSVKEDGSFGVSEVRYLEVSDLPHISTACNIDISSVVFTSKIPATAPYEDKTYKLTVKDKEIKMSLTQGKAVKTRGNAVEIPYTVSGNNQYKINQISALITDKDYTSDDASIKYYGALRTDFSDGNPSGIVSFTLPDDFCEDDKLYILAETVHLGDEYAKTDYASNLVEVPVDSTPFITKQPADLSLVYGYDKAEISVSAKAPIGSSLSYQWYLKNDRSDASGNIIDGATKQDLSITKGKKAGTVEYYYCVITNNKTSKSVASEVATVTVKSAEMDATLPQGVTGIIYGEDDQSLIVPGETKDGKFYYGVADSEKVSPDDIDWDESVPQATKPGVFYVWYKAVGDADHTDIEPTCIVVTVMKKKSTVEGTLPQEITGLTYDGTEQDLLIPGKTKDGTFYYGISISKNAAPTDIKWGKSIPKAKDPGIYYVWYRAVGDSDHEDIEPTCIVVSIESKKDDIIVIGGNYMTPVMEITDKTTELYMVTGQSFILPEKNYQSTNSKLVSISKKGVLKARAVTGSSPVKIVSGERSIDIYVSYPMLSTKSLKINAGETAQLVFNYDKEHYDVLWESSDINVATVTQDGSINAIAKGRTTVTAHINGKSYKCKVSVAEPTPVSERTVHINVGKTKNINLKGVKNYSWTISGNCVQPVNSRKIKGVEVGNAELTATDLNGKEYKAFVIVDDPEILCGREIVKAKGNSYKLALYEGDEIHLSYKGVSYPVLFTSSKPSIVYDDGAGTIKTLGKGTAKLKTKINGTLITINVTVN